MQSLDSFLPKESVDSIKKWLTDYNCQLSIKKSRATKLGDYRFYKGQHHISINNDLNPYSFLITLTHEIAHMVVKEEYSPRVLPHGKEWKMTFQKLMIPFLPVFPEEIQKHLALHLKNPKASTSSDFELVKALRQFDEKHILTISDIPNGTVFETSNGKKYLKEKRLKKRYQCKSLSNNKRYLFNPLAEVKI